MRRDSCTKTEGMAQQQHFQDKAGQIGNTRAKHEYKEQKDQGCEKQITGLGQWEERAGIELVVQGVDTGEERR